MIHSLYEVIEYASSIVTLFPEFFDSPLRVSIVGRAVDAGLVDIDIVDLRAHGLGPHRQVDDAPFGGGPGMVMMIEPLADALDPLESSHRVLLTPGGSRLSQDHLDRWSSVGHLTLVCGRFEESMSESPSGSSTSRCRSGTSSSPGERLSPPRLSKESPACCPVSSEIRSRSNARVSVVACWRNPSTRGPPSFGGGPFRRSC